MEAEALVIGNPGCNDMPMLASAFSPSWSNDSFTSPMSESNTDWSLGPTPLSSTASTWDFIGDPTCTTNAFDLDGNDVGENTLEDFQNVQNSLVLESNIRQALSPPTPSTWLDLESCIASGKNCVSGDKSIYQNSNTPLGSSDNDSQGGFCSPADTLQPEPSQFEHWSAQANKATGTTRGHLSSSNICPEIPHAHRDPAFATIPPMATGSNIEMAMTELDIRHSWTTLVSGNASPVSCDQVSCDHTATLPGLVSPDQLENSLGHPWGQLPACSVPEPLNQEVGSDATVSPEFAQAPEDLDLSFYSYDDSQSQLHISLPMLNSPFCLDRTQSSTFGILDPTDTRFRFVEDHTQSEEKVSDLVNGLVSASGECIYDSFTPGVDTSSTGGDRQSTHNPITRNTHLVSLNDTPRNSQTIHNKCDYTSPVTGEPCHSISHGYMITTVIN